MNSVDPPAISAASGAAAQGSLDPFKPVDTTWIQPLRSDNTMPLLYRAAIADTLNKKYASHLNQRCFEVFCWCKDDAAYVTMLLSDAQESYYYPVETCMQLGEQAPSPLEAAYLLCDYVDLYWQSYFAEEEEVYVPITWTEVNFQGHALYIKGQILNKALASEGDRLLQQAAAVPQPPQ